MNGVVTPTPNVYANLPGYGPFRPRWGDPDDLPKHQLGSTFYSLLPFIEQTALFEDPLTCYRTSLPVLHIPSRRSGIQEMPATDPVYPGWSYETDGQGPSGRTDYASNDQVFCTTYAGWGKVLRYRDIRDGTTHTIFIGEKAMAQRAYIAGVGYWDEPWIMGGTGGAGRCGDELYSDMSLNDFPERVSGAGWTEGSESCGGGNWGTPSPGGPQFALGDGSVRMLSFQTDRTVVRNLIRPADGNVIGIE